MLLVIFIGNSLTKISNVANFVPKLLEGLIISSYFPVSSILLFFIFKPCLKLFSVVSILSNGKDFNGTPFLSQSKAFESVFSFSFDSISISTKNDFPSYTSIVSYFGSYTLLSFTTN